MKRSTFKTLSSRGGIAAILILSGAVWAGPPEAELDPMTAEEPFVSALDADVLLPEDTTLSAQDKAIMSQVTPEQFDRLVDGADPATIETRDGATVDDLIATAELGDNDEQLVFTAINPCRVIDTGKAVGNFSAGETRSYTLSGKSDFTALGGSNGKCTLPGNQGFIVTSRIVRAWAFNVIAAAPQGGGNFQTWPANQAPSASSAVNFQKLTPNLNNANALIVANCDDTGSLIGPNPLCPEGDVKFKANSSGARLVVEVLGYFTRADISGLKTGVNEGTKTADVSLTDKNCHNLTSCGRSIILIGSPAPAGKFVVTGSANFDVTAGSGFANRFLTLTDANGTTCNSSNDPHTATLETKWAGSLIDKQLNVQGVFPVAAGATKTIFLNAEVSGDISSAHVNSSSVICTFIPD